MCARKDLSSPIPQEWMAVHMCRKHFDTVLFAVGVALFAEGQSERNVCKSVTLYCHNALLSKLATCVDTW